MAGAPIRREPALWGLLLAQIPFELLFQVNRRPYQQFVIQHLTPQSPPRFSRRREVVYLLILLEKERDFQTVCPCVLNRAILNYRNRTGKSFADGGTVDASNVDGVLNCDQDAVSACFEACFHLPIVNSKLDRFSLLRKLPSAISFAKSTLGKGKRLLVCCSNGEDISICVCLAILTSLFTVGGCFDDGKSFSETCITKLEMLQRVLFICKFAANTRPSVRPSRGNLKQV